MLKEIFLIAADSDGGACFSNGGVLCFKQSLYASLQGNLNRS